MKNNRHSRIIPEQVIAQVNENMLEIQTLLKPYLTIGLTPQNRQKLLKMGPGTLDFVGSGFDVGKKYPNVLPGQIDLDEFEIDYIDARQIYFFQESLGSLLRSVTDLGMVAGSEALQQALAVYAAVKMAASQEVPGMQAVYENMRTKYPTVNKRGASKKTEPESAPQ